MHSRAKRLWLIVQLSALTLNLPGDLAGRVAGQMFRVETASTILNNGEISVNLTDSGDFASFTHTTAARSPPPTHTFTPLSGTDGWRIVVSDYNATSNVVVLGPSTCSTPTNNATTLSAAFTYTCYNRWVVVVEYSVPARGATVRKGLRLGSLDGKPWASTIRVVELARGLGLSGAQTPGQTYTGMIAMEPSSQEFHPKVGESPEVK